LSVDEKVDAMDVSKVALMVDLMAVKVLQMVLMYWVLK